MKGMESRSSHRMDMTEGPLFSQIIRFTVPLFFTLILQLMFNAADLIVIGRFAAHEAMAAVGATSSLIHMIINIFFGLAIGTNVVAANAYGAKDQSLLSRTTHTSMVVAVVGGVLVAAFGYAFARPLLEMMATPANVLEKATLYMRIYFLGLPVLMVYNFGSAVLRAVGDTRRPLIYLAVSGVLNVPLNLLLVLRFGMDVDGVAWATVLSQIVSSALVWRALASSRDGCRLEWCRLRVHWPVLRRMLEIGVPSAAQASCFSLSNILIQSAVNSFGSLAMAGSSATLSLEGIVYCGPYALHQATISFAGQNYGARQYARLRRSIWYCFWVSVVISSVMGPGAWLIGPELLSIYSTDPAVIAWGMKRIVVTFTTYALAGMMDVVSGAMRGIDKSLLSAIIVLVCVCGFRVVWLYTAFPMHRTMEMLMLSYPITWGLATLVNGVILVRALRRLGAGEPART